MTSRAKHLDQDSDTELDWDVACADDGVARVPHVAGLMTGHRVVGTLDQCHWLGPDYSGLPPETVDEMYSECLRVLFSAGQIKLGLQRMEAFLGKLGDPQDQYKVVHVAGTNGKGSVCLKIAEGLSLSGERVGLFSSPHISSLRERFVVNGVIADKVAVLECVHAIWNLGKRYDLDRPTFFETCTLTALTYFARSGCTYVVLEAGMGGRLDATNVIVRPAAACVTSIGWDHMQFLGNTLDEISKEKAGIFKPKVPAIIGPKAARKPLVALAEENSSRVIFVPSHLFSTVDEENKAIARAVLSELPLPTMPSVIDEALCVRPLCRQQILRIDQMQVAALHIHRVLDFARRCHVLAAELSAARLPVLSSRVPREMNYARCLPFDNLVEQFMDWSELADIRDEVQLMMAAQKVKPEIAAATVREDVVAHFLCYHWAKRGMDPAEVSVYTSEDIFGEVDKPEETRPMQLSENYIERVQQIADLKVRLRTLGRDVRVHQTMRFHTYPCPVGVVLDVGHNFDAVSRALTEAWNAFPFCEFHLLLGSSRDLQIFRGADGPFCRNKKHYLKRVWLLEGESSRCRSISEMVSSLEKEHIVTPYLRQKILDGVKDVSLLRDALFPRIANDSELLEDCLTQALRGTRVDSLSEELQVLVNHSKPKIVPGPEPDGDPTGLAAPVEPTTPHDVLKGSVQWVTSLAFQTAAVENCVLVVCGSFFHMGEVLDALGMGLDRDPQGVSDFMHPVLDIEAIPPTSESNWLAKRLTRAHIAAKDPMNWINRKELLQQDEAVYRLACRSIRQNTLDLPGHTVLSMITDFRPAIEEVIREVRRETDTQVL